MKNRFRLIHRGDRGNQFYCVDSESGKRFSLKTKDLDAARQIVLAKNQAIRQPTLNRQIAKAYLSGTDAGMSTRTWQTALEAMVERKHGPTRDRWERGIKNHALDLIRHCVIVETQPEQLWQTLKAGTVSTNVHLRELHNFCLAMSWLPWPWHMKAALAQSSCSIKSICAPTLTPGSRTLLAWPSRQGLRSQNVERAK
jgi:hypothetical protein